VLPISLSDWMETTLTRGKRIHQILIADNHLLFRRGLRSLLSAEADLQVLDEATDTAETLAKVRLLRPDVLVMNLALLEATGKQSVLEIRQATRDVAILFLTEEDGPEQLEFAIGAGARGYMLKGSGPAELVAGIRQIAASEDPGPHGLSKVVPDLRALAVTNEGYRLPTALTSREQEVVRLLADGRTVREVASELALSVKTIEAHKLNLMRKLDIHNRTSLIEYAATKGLLVASPTR